MPLRNIQNILIFFFFIFLYVSFHADAVSQYSGHGCVQVYANKLSKISQIHVKSARGFGEWKKITLIGSGYLSVGKLGKPYSQLGNGVDEYFFKNVEIDHRIV